MKADKSIKPAEGSTERVVEVRVLKPLTRQGRDLEFGSRTTLRESQALRLSAMGTVEIITTVKEQ